VHRPPLNMQISTESSSCKMTNAIGMP
jgi:hypothetical protein